MGYRRSTAEMSEIWKEIQKKEYERGLKKLSSPTCITEKSGLIISCFAPGVLLHDGNKYTFLEANFNEIWKQMRKVHNYNEAATTDMLVAMTTSLKRTALKNTRDGFCFVRMKTNAAPRITENEATAMQCHGLSLTDGKKKWESHFKGDNKSFFTWVISMYRKFPDFERQLFADADAKFEAIKNESAGRKLKSKKPTAPKKVIKKSSSSASDLPDHLDHLESKRGKRERPSDLNTEGSPVAKKQKTEPSPVTSPPKVKKSSSSAKPARKKELSNTGQRCAYCGGPAKIFCSGCEEKKEETYCSQEHQNLHWPKHQPFCKSCTNYEARG